MQMREEKSYVKAVNTTNKILGFGFVNCRQTQGNQNRYLHQNLI